MNEKIKKFLINIGLSEKESSVYLALLPVDAYSVIDLAKATGINRTTLYPILEDLVKKRLIVEIKHDKKTVFQAEPPERIETFVQNRKTQLEEQEKVLSDIIPQMRGISRKLGEKPVVKVYEGREGILRSIEEHYETSQHEDEEYLIYPRDIIKNMFTSKEQEQAKKSRLQRKVHMNSIFTSQEDYPSNEMASRYRIDEEKYPIKCEMGIYSDGAYIHILSEEHTAVYIRSKDFAETLKTLFRLAIEGIKANQSK